MNWVGFSKLLLAFIVPIFVFLALGTVLDFYLDNNYPESIAIGTTGPFVFIFFIALDYFSLQARPREETLRAAIASALVVQYMTLVGVVAFFNSGTALPPITQTLLSNFTTIIGVVIAFFFGASAYVQATKQAADKKNKSDDESKSDDAP